MTEESMSQIESNIDIVDINDFKAKNKEIVDGNYENILFVITKTNFNIELILNIIQAYKHHDNVNILIDACDFTEEENETFDEIVEYLTGDVNVMINDDIDEIREFIKSYAEYYK